MRERTENFYTASYLGEKAQVVERDGDLYIEGWAADVTLDDLGEFFDYKALEDAAAEWMAQPNRPLLYHHKPDMQLGEVLFVEPRRTEERAGLWMKARIDQPVGHPVLTDVYEKVKRGTMKGLSVAGKWFGDQTAEGWRITRAALREISVTPFPVNPRTLATVAQKAFDDCGCQEQELEDARRLLAESEALADGLEAIVAAKAAPTAEQRKKYGMKPDGAFPVWHCGSGPGSVKSALKLAGQGKNHSREAVMAHIRRRAKALGCSEQVKGD